MADTTAIGRRPRVVILGGGVAALEALIGLRVLAEMRFEVDLLAPESHFWYRPLAVAEPFGDTHVEAFELAAIADSCGAEFCLAAASEVAPAEHVVRTTAGAAFEYDHLIVACGARAQTVLENALMFRGPADSDAYVRLLGRLARERGPKIVFALPPGATWPLPLYELALLTAKRLPGAEITVVTPEATPLAPFGVEAGRAVERLFAARKIELHAATSPVAAEARTLVAAPHAEFEFDALVTVPRLRGEPLDGLPHDDDGFVHTDDHGGVQGVEDVYAAGDITAFPVKQGGLAADQADAIVEAIAARHGIVVEPEPFRPVLRGLLLTGDGALYLRAEVQADGEKVVAVGEEPLWWPKAKIVGRYLSPFLAEWLVAPAVP